MDQNGLQMTFFNLNAPVSLRRKKFRRYHSTPLTAHFFQYPSRPGGILIPLHVVQFTLAAMSSNLSSRFPLFKYLAQTLTNRFKERDFRIVKKYHCWQQNKSSWKNQYPSRQGGRRRGVTRSAPVAHHSGRRAVLTIFGNCLAFLSRFWGSFEIFSPSVPEISTSIIGTTWLDALYIFTKIQKFLRWSLISQDSVRGS